MSIRVDSPEWKAIVQHGEERIAKLRAQNDAMTNNAEETARIRASIAAWKEILRLPDKHQAPKIQDDPPY